MCLWARISATLTMMVIQIFIWLPAALSMARSLPRCFFAIARERISRISRRPLELEICTRGTQLLSLTWATVESRTYWRRLADLRRETRTNFAYIKILEAATTGLP